MGTCPSGWGPDKREDLWLKIDIGGRVEINRIDLAIRADFPHDAFWHEATVEFSASLPILLLLLDRRLGIPGHPSSEGVDCPSQSVSPPPKVCCLLLGHSLQELGQFLVVLVRPGVFCRRVPLQTFVRVPLVRVAHQRVN